jgi:hypothetical protein
MIELSFGDGAKKWRASDDSPPLLLVLPEMPLLAVPFVTLSHHPTEHACALERSTDAPSTTPRRCPCGQSR